MEMSNHIICAGSGHLALQVARRLREKNYEVFHVNSAVEEKAEKGIEHSVLERLRRVFRDAGIDRAKAVFLVHDDDRRNIEMSLVAISLNQQIPVIVTLFNEGLASHLQATHANLFVRSPARIACPQFVECLRAPRPLEHRYKPPPPERIRSRDPLAHRSLLQVYALAAAFFTVLVAGAVFFHESGRLSWLDAFYAITRVVATDDFGEAAVRGASTGAKLFGIFVMFSAVALVAITIALIADRLVKRNAEIALGRRRYRLRGHVVVCGVGRVGYQIAEELLRSGEQVLVIEKSPENRFLDTVRAHGARVLIGDASLPRILKDAGVGAALALISVTDDDLKNLEIGLNARSLRPELRLILRIFDKGIAEEMRERLDIHYALSTSAIAAERLVEILEKGRPPGGSGG